MHPAPTSTTVTFVHDLLSQLLPLVALALAGFGARLMHVFAAKLSTSAWHGAYDLLAQAADAAVAEMQQKYVPELREESGKLTPSNAELASKMAAQRAMEIAGQRTMKLAAKHGFTADQMMALIESSVVKLKASIPPVAVLDAVVEVVAKGEQIKPTPAEAAPTLAQIVTTGDAAAKPPSDGEAP